MRSFDGPAKALRPPKEDSEEVIEMPECLPEGLVLR